MNVDLNFPQHRAVLQQVIGGVTLAQYAEVLAKRERLLDDGKIEKGIFGVKGDKDWVLMMLEGSCERYRLPYVPGDLDKTARSVDWDNAIRTNPAVQAAWRDVYAAALVEMNNLPTLGPAYEQHRRTYAANDEVLFNPFQTIARRKPHISTAAKSNQADQLVQAYHAQTAPGGDGGDADPVVFPGERLSKMSDFVRIQKAMQRGDFPGVLTREGIDMGYYGQMSIRWAQAVQTDPSLAMRYARALSSA
jgi:hypothetical protein